MLTRLSPDMVEHFTRAGFWSDDTIYDCVCRHAAQQPDRVAILDHGIALTYGALADLSARMAARLATAGLKPGDRVAAWVSSRAEVSVLLSACAAGGFVLCPSLHRNHTVGEICALLGRMRARALIVEAGFGADADRHDILTGAAEAADLAYTCVLSRAAPRTAEDIGVALDLGSEKVTANRDGTDIVYLAFTSGTTGEPKGVMHSSNTLLANARALAGDWGFDATSVTYSLGPLSHNLGFGALVLTLLTGGELVIHDLPRGRPLLNRLRDLKATFLFGVPAHAMDLLAEIEADGGPKPALPDLRGFRISGAAVPAWVVERLIGQGITPQSGYGMTEACSHHYTRPGDTPDRVVGTSGRSCPGYEVKVFAIDDPNRVLPAGEIGHVGGRGASLMMGYFDDQAATERAFNADGWFMTGDLGRMDADGYLTLTGRLKEIIIRGGHNIHPARIEQLTMRHPGVERVAALGVRDERLGEKVCLVVMPKNGALDPQSVLHHLFEAGLSKYDMPEYYLEVDEIPLSASGKMLKRALLPDIDAGRLTPMPVRFTETA
ncbi:class I adenylate-forming enzyme family protein [Chachezhania antarctica]|uniref:class I adenylate-forming enzyme family protein n=1 Tax=Chachezhania antarctica TaxID=2340860 RepID=UPI000EAF3794|nr:class I adenylate-forming enzyme family protein [Chachezhania antarctica]